MELLINLDKLKEEELEQLGFTGEEDFIAGIN